MGDVVNLVFVQADTFNQVNLNFITSRNATEQIVTSALGLLRDREHGRNIVAWVRVVCGKKCIVKV